MAEPKQVSSPSGATGSSASQIHPDSAPTVLESQRSLTVSGLLHCAGNPSLGSHTCELFTDKTISLDPDFFPPNEVAFLDSRDHHPNALGPPRSPEEQTLACCSHLFFCRNLFKKTGAYPWLIPSSRLSLKAVAIDAVQASIQLTKGKRGSRLPVGMTYSKQ